LDSLKKTYLSLLLSIVPRIKKKKLNKITLTKSFLAPDTQVKRLSIKNKDITSDLMFLYECVVLLEREREREIMFGREKQGL
jgi:hypothetical protein